MNNAMEASGATALAAPLSALTLLRTLKLSLNGLGNAGIATLAPALANMPRLTCLQVDGSEMCVLLRSWAWM